MVKNRMSAETSCCLMVQETFPTLIDLFLALKLDQWFLFLSLTVRSCVLLDVLSGFFFSSVKMVM